MSRDHSAPTQPALLLLVRAFWKLCIFQLAPQDIPRAPMLLILCTLANLGFSTLINQIQLPLASALLAAVVESVVLVSLTSALLFYFAKMPRAIQTLTALMGSGAVIGAIVLALLLAVPQLPQFMRILIFLWNLMIMAHILRHALGLHLIAAFFIALGYAIFLIQVIVFIGRSLSASIA